MKSEKSHNITFTLNKLEEFYKICEETFFPIIDLRKYEIPLHCLHYIPENVARMYKVIPLSKVGPMLTVAIADPRDILLIDNLKIITQLEISPVAALPQQIEEVIDKYYSLKTTEIQETKLNKNISEQQSVILQEERLNVEELKKISEKSEIINLVNQIFQDAVKMRTSDIHLEPTEEGLSVRYRIDGMLQKIRVIEHKYKDAVTIRIKLLSSMDITEKRIPQDGRLGFRAQERDIDVRVSVLPTHIGEKIVMRLLDKGAVKLELESLGFSPYALELFKKAISKPFGMILLTGPTGSGKTTTLYSILNSLNSITKNIVTIEDPVEYNLAGITQVPVKSEIGLDFANILRAVLRQSPDIIMIGEIRDKETADIAMKAALTGHLVLSTLHTNDAPSAVVRLLNMEIEPFLIATALSMVAAQRLVRKICPDCKISYKFDLSHYYDIPEKYRLKDVTLYKGTGCTNCRNSGYKGRIAVTEVFYLDDVLREMIIKKASVAQLQEYACKNCGMKTLREDALEKCLRGETTFEEVLRVTLA